MIRNQDNYTNAYQYIKEQLFIYNYSNPIHVHLLKMKLWALDADILESENIAGETPDIIFNKPMDHKASLENELFFLDLYRKTKENLLEKYEQPFPTVVTNRKNMLSSWIKQKDPITGLPRKDYEMSYSARPLLMTEQEIDELYQLYKIKEAAGELSNCLEIKTKITEDNLTTRAFAAELAVINYVYPPESEQNMLEQATKLKLAEDDDLVNELNKAKQKILNEYVNPIITNKIDVSPVPPSLQRMSADIVAVNMPSDRLNVIAQRHAGNRKGFINDYDETGGYRYPIDKRILRVWKIASVTVDYTVTSSTEEDGTVTNSYTWNSYTIVPIGNPQPIDIDTEPTGMNTTFTSNVPLYNNSVERNWNYFDLAVYYVNTTTDAESGVSSTSVVLDKFPNTRTPRFNELNSRWTNLNVFREHKIDNAGLRIQLEALLDTDIPLMIDQLRKQLADLLEEKIHITQILREDCLFNEWI